MQKEYSLLSLEDEITDLQRKLDSLTDSFPLTSKTALELSEQLDLLIVKYYNLMGFQKNL